MGQAADRWSGTSELCSNRIGDWPVDRDAVGVRLLLVEDDELVRACLVDMLDDAGFRVVSVSNAADALALGDGTEEPDVLVTDVYLGPGMNGMRLLALARDRWPGIGAVLISGDGLLAHKFTDPAARFLPKPFCGAELVRAIRDSGSMRADRRTPLLG